MRLLNDIHHLTFLTADMDRLINFYAGIFGARVTAGLEEESLRHAFIEVGRTPSCTRSRCPGFRLRASSRCSAAGGSIISP